MTRRVFGVGLAFALGVGLMVTLGDVQADDEKEKSEKKDEKKDEKPDTITVRSTSEAAGPKFPGYIHVATVTGEVVRASDSSVTIRLFWQAPGKKGGKGNNRGARPNLNNSNGRSMMNPSSRGRQGGSKGGVHWEHHDYTIDFHPEGLARVKTLPKKTDSDGKRVDYTTKEIQDLREPAGFPGYMGSKGDLVPGTIVEAYVIRDRAVPQAKATESDMKLKWVKAIGMDPNASKNLADAKKGQPKKKKNK